MHLRLYYRPCCIFLHGLPHFTRLASNIACFLAYHRSPSPDFTPLQATFLYFALLYPKLLVSHSWISYVLPPSYPDLPYHIMFSS
jgi:hypothetical protein